MVQLFLRSKQDLRLPSFFQTRTTALAHGLCDFWNGTNVQYLLEMGLHIIIHMRGYASECSLKGIQSVTSIQCLIRAVQPRSRSLWANRCSHLSSSSVACSCSASGHSPGPWRSRASKIHLFWGLQVDPLRFLLGGPPVVLGWQA